MNTTMKLGLAFSLVCAFVAGSVASVNAYAAAYPETHGASNATTLDSAPQSLTVIMPPTVIVAPKVRADHKTAAPQLRKVAAPKSFVCGGAWHDLQGSTGQYRNCEWK